MSESKQSVFGKFSFPTKATISAPQGAQDFINSNPSKMYAKPVDASKKQIFAFDSLNKKERFEQFLTYRKRLSRLALVQACYLYEVQFLTSDENLNSELASVHLNKVVKTDDIIKSVIFLYRNIFFYGRYGPINKKKKLEEKWLYDCLSDIIKYVNDLDDRIRQKLSKKWTVYKLDPVVRAILRCAVYEMLYNPSATKKIVICEYVRLSTSFYDDPKVFGFINGILDGIAEAIGG